MADGSAVQPRRPTQRVSPPNTMTPFGTGLAAGAGPHASARRLQRAARRRGLHAGPRGHAQWHGAAAACDIRSLLPRPARPPVVVGPARPVLRQSAASARRRRSSRCRRCWRRATASCRTLPWTTIGSRATAAVPASWASTTSTPSPPSRFRCRFSSSPPPTPQQQPQALDAADHSRLCLALLGRSRSRPRPTASPTCRRGPTTPISTPPGTRFSYPASSAPSWRPATASTPTSARSPTRAIASRARAWR